MIPPVGAAGGSTPAPRRGASRSFQTPVQVGSCRLVSNVTATARPPRRRLKVYVSEKWRIDQLLHSPTSSACTRASVLARPVAPLDPWSARGGAPAPQSRPYCAPS
eukprot:351465-Alexandrium_andersonii.AAC.1